MWCCTQSTSMSAWGLAIFIHTPTMCAAPRKSQRTHARTQHPLNDIPAQRQQQTKTNRRPTETIVEIEVCVQRAFVPERRELDIFIGCFLSPPQGPCKMLEGLTSKGAKKCLSALVSRLELMRPSFFVDIPNRQSLRLEHKLNFSALPFRCASSSTEILEPVQSSPHLLLVVADRILGLVRGWCRSMASQPAGYG
uniref:Putative secreted protein n=1 Tax=Anopheles marajoara TaxID=58244 RepID=A0A2M4C614_9DIPT